eukprot:Phypoly_transcript_16424.p1 GENE.Phypoly_transcript_16424~~Phypoly_transcript_16424.p1  ORF type:complete len:237 (+),score=75.52 Phypoly_transcript_16424:29-712(+)
MADKGDDNLSLPKATVSKLIKEMLPEDVKCSNDTRDLILECCVEFIHLISSEANDIANKEKKKTIAAEHVLKALTALGFDEFTEDVTEVYEKHKTEAQAKPKGTRRLENLGIPEEQLLRDQQQLFARARNALQSSQQGLPPPMVDPNAPGYPYPGTTSPTSMPTMPSPTSMPMPTPTMQMPPMPTMPTPTPTMSMPPMPTPTIPMPTMPSPTSMPFPPMSNPNPPFG